MLGMEVSTLPRQKKTETNTKHWSQRFEKVLTRKLFIVWTLLRLNTKIDTKGWFYQESLKRVNLRPFHAQEKS